MRQLRIERLLQGKDHLVLREGLAHASKLSRQAVQLPHHLKTPGASKLLPKFVGPLTICAKVTKVAMKLELPENMREHNVFHVSLLKYVLTYARIPTLQSSSATRRGRRRV